MNQTVDTTWQTDEDTEVSDGLDGTLNNIALVAASCEFFPWVLLALLNAQGDTTTLFVDVQNHNFNFVTLSNNFAWVDVLVGPVHFGNVYQTFNTLFQLNKAAVVGQVGNVARNLGAFGEALLDVDPWIFTQLLQAQRNAVALTVELQNLNKDLVANIDDFTWMLDTLPSHVSDVQQAVNAAQINKCAVVGQVLDNALDFETFL